MPGDQPTTSAGDTGSSGATFRGSVERVDETTGAAPTTPARPSQPAAAAAPPGARTESAVDATTAPQQPVATAPRTESADATAGPVTVAPAIPTEPAPTPTPGPGAATGGTRRRSKRAKVRARKVRRVVRHIDPWSVLKISLLFYTALFLIICVASVLLWGVARSSGTIDNVESFITSVGGFGNCEPIAGAETAPTTTTLPGAAPTAPVDQLDPTGADPSVPVEDEGTVSPGDDEDCREGEELVGEFRFEDARIFQAFALGGSVLVIAGTAANLVLVLLFNLMSDLTGGVRVTVLEEEPPARGTRARTAVGSPAPTRRG